MGTENNVNDNRDAPLPNSDQRSTEGERLRSGLAVHEAGDRAKQDSVARAWAMLREAAELGERAISELTHERVDTASQQRALLAALRTDVTQLQEHVERLARRVTDVINIVESAGSNEHLPVPPPLPSVPPPPRQVVPAPSLSHEDHVPAIASPLRARASTGGMADSARSRPGPLTMVVHSVPSAATAMSLQRFLTGLNQVSLVEPEQFAAGELRLRITTSEPIDLDDLRGWQDGDRLVLVTQRADQIEVRFSTNRDE